MSTTTRNIYPPRDCYMERMDDPEFLTLHEWLADLFDTDLTTQGLVDTLSVRLRHILSKGDPECYESVYDIVYAFFSEDVGFCFPSTPCFDWAKTTFGSTRSLWFRQLQDRKKRNARTTIIDDVCLFDIMEGDAFKPVQEWLEQRSLEGKSPNEIANDLKCQIEMVLNKNDPCVPLTVERIADNFFDPEVYFTFYPYVFGVPMEHTEFGHLRNSWIRYHNSYEN